jgi:hypothetical protein
MNERTSIGAFRKRLMDDAEFRQAFAADPEGTLRASGITVPDGTNLAAIDATELEARVCRLKEALGDEVGALYSDDAFDAVVKDPEKVLRLQGIMNLARTGELAPSQLEAVAGGAQKNPGETYRISAFSTIDW